MHKIHHIGNSGIIFTKCGEIAGNRAYIKATDNDSEVTCRRCLQKMRSIKKDEKDEKN